MKEFSYSYIEDNKWHLIEIIAVFLLGLSKIVIGDLLQSRFYFMATGILFWLGFIILRCSLDPKLLSSWGFNTNNFSRSFTSLIPFLILSIGGCILYGILWGSPLFNLNFFIVLFLYPGWGVIQQFLVAVLLAGNLDRISRKKIPSRGIVLIVSILFALVHFPEIPLVIVAFLLGMVTIKAYLRYGNIWTIGLVHGWFATFFYYIAWARDPLQEIIKSF